MPLDTQCQRCDYDLTGAPARGQCPECGNRFDVESGQGVVRHNAALQSHQRGDRVIYWVKVGSLLTGAAVCVGLGLWRATASPNPAGALLVAGLLGATFAFAAGVTWWTDRPEA